MALTFVGGTGICIYIAALLFVPAQGERVQSIGAWTCEGGNAQTRLAFTCSDGEREFVTRLAE